MKVFKNAPATCILFEHRGINQGFEVAPPTNFSCLPSAESGFATNPVAGADSSNEMSLNMCEMKPSPHLAASFGAFPAALQTVWRIISSILARRVHSRI